MIDLLEFDGVKIGQDDPHNHAQREKPGFNKVRPKRGEN